MAKHLSWQSMALGGALAVAFSAAVPGTGTQNSSPVPQEASFEVEAGADGVVEATLILDPKAKVADVLIWSSNAIFGDAVETEPGVWVAQAAGSLDGGCYEVTAEVTVGGAPGAPKKVKPAKVKHDPPKTTTKVKPPKPSKKLSPPGAGVVLSITTTSCTPCSDDPFRPLPGVS